MRMNISVPDQLAGEVRQRDIPISAVCQRALRDEVARLRITESAKDIAIVPNDQDLMDSHAWAQIAADKPILTFRNRPGRPPGWVLLQGLGPEPGNLPEGHWIPGLPDDPISALRLAREWLRRTGNPGEMSKITVDVGHPLVTVGFTGRWLVKPDPDETRSSEIGQEAGIFFGVALTARGRIAIFTAHCDDRRPAQLDDYDSLDQAAGDVPADIIARAAAELGETRVLWRDI